MKKVLSLFILLAAMAASAFAQQGAVTPARVVTACAGQTLTVGQVGYLNITADGTLCTSTTINTTGLATSANQTDGSQKVQVYYGGTSTPILSTDVAPVSMAASSAAAGAFNLAIPDPCATGTKLYYVINLTSATAAEIANAVASEYWHICSVNIIAQGAAKVLIGIDDTDGCGSISEGLNGGTADTTGWSFTADGSGLTLGNGMGTVMKSATANRYLCIDSSTTAQLSGTIAYVSSTQ
jgi:hypothetical protein